MHGVETADVENLSSVTPIDGMCPVLLVPHRSPNAGLTERWLP